MSVGRGVGMALAGVLLTAGPAAAHNLLCECTLRNGRVRVEAFYDTNEPAKAAKVPVLSVVLGIGCIGMFMLLLWLRNRMLKNRRRAKLAMREFRAGGPLRLPDDEGSNGTF